ncbi:LAGLIDADG family homing endonuclease [Micromonospora sp. NPDC005220]|uniref:LAGLIDADG family homing endonuclease n=1 Tax=Micromonospora sp. NPDC005220 TaxID=3155589 RepID=UPI0033A7E618
MQIQDLVGVDGSILASNGRWSNAQVIRLGRRRLYEVRVGRYREEHVIRAAAGHRWLLRPKVAHRRVEAATVDLRLGDRLSSAFPRRLREVVPSRTGIARGFVFGDGSISGGALAHASFFGEKDEALLRYFDNIERLRTYYYKYLPGSPGRKLHIPANEVTERLLASGEVKTYRRLGGFPREWKREYPALDADAEMIFGWLAGYFAADGDVGASGRPSIWSADRANLEFFKEACSTIGIWTLPIRGRIRRGFGKFDTEVFVMGISRADLSADFFLLNHHRERWNANRKAVERRGWTVRGVRETLEVESVFGMPIAATSPLTLKGNILTGGYSA